MAGSTALALGLAGAGLAWLARSPPPEVPANYPSDYGATIAAAGDEGTVVVYSTTDDSVAMPLIRDFEHLYPSVKVEYHDLNSFELNARYLAETAARRPSADVLWSSAMDLQMKLVNDNFAQRYRSPETTALPEWAVWREAGFATTFEPAVFVYNKQFVAPADVPHTHAEFLRLLTTQPGKYTGNVTTYDVERSAVGFLFASEDSRMQAGFWSLAAALGRNGVDQETSTAVMMERIASGRAYLGYNVIGSYALGHGRVDPAIGVVMPGDYTLAMSRIMLLSRTAAHPQAGRLWLDYLLSRRGQGLLSERSGLFSIRSDAAGELTEATLRKTLGASARPIGFNPSLLVFLDHSKRQEFLRRWRQETVPVN